MADADWARQSGLVSTPRSCARTEIAQSTLFRRRLRIDVVRGVVLLALSVLATVACAGSEGLETKTAAPIAFVHGDGTIYLVKADGSGRHRLPMRRHRYISNVAWSPDARKIAYDSNEGILVVNVDGGVVRLLSRTGFELRPAWSPDGREIAFDQNEDGYSSIWVVRTGGGHARRLTPGVEFGGPVWSPDGRTMLLTHRYNGLYSIKVSPNSPQTGPGDRRKTGFSRVEVRRLEHHCRMVPERQADRVPHADGTVGHESRRHGKARAPSSS